ncbi:MAG: hypothetical protein Q8N99_05540 [Nanoarchaeota archaeon]|nr:hypothetical protein [Nanoarchaeota archaeon]
MKKINYIFIILILLIILISVFYLSRNVKKPVCGNGVIEKGESSNNCCVDVGCPNDYICENNKCISNISDTNNITNTAPPIPPVIYETIEATILNLSVTSHKIFTIGDAEYYGKYAIIRVDKIIDYKRLDPYNETYSDRLFKPLSVGDKIEVSFEWNTNTTKVGDKILTIIELHQGYNLWVIRTDYKVLE